MGLFSKLIKIKHTQEKQPEKKQRDWKNIIHMETRNHIAYRYLSKK